MMSTKASTLRAPSSKLQADEGVTVLKVPYKSSKQAEERLLRLVNEGSLSEFPHEYYTPEEDRPVLSRKALAESSAPCLVISHTKSSWWRSALGTDKLKVLPVSQISSIVIGQESPVFVKALRGGFKLPAPDHCLTIHTRSRTLDFILPSAEQCTALKQELQSLLPNQVPPVVATAKQTIARPAPALPPAPLQDMRNKSNAGAVVSNAGAVVDAGAWTDARRQAYLASAVLQHIESDAVADLAICLDDGKQTHYKCLNVWVSLERKLSLPHLQAAPWKLETARNAHCYSLPATRARQIAHACCCCEARSSIRRMRRRIQLYMWLCELGASDALRRS